MNFIIIEEITKSPLRSSFTITCQRMLGASIINPVRDQSLITGSRGGGQFKFYPYKKWQGEQF